MPEYYKIKGETLTNIADAIREKIGNGGGAITPLDMPQEIASISNGTSITDGIVVKARDANGNPTEVDYYGDVVPVYCFGFNSYGEVNNPFNYTQTINWKSEVKTIMRGAFKLSNLINLVIPQSVTSVEHHSNGIARSSSKLKTVQWLTSFKLDFASFTDCVAIESFIAPNISEIKNDSGNAQWGGRLGDVLHCKPFSLVVLVIP